jgi:hypothetical protein
MPVVAAFELDDAVAAYPLLAWLLLTLPGNADDCANRENPVKTL